MKLSVVLLSTILAVFMFSGSEAKSSESLKFIRFYVANPLVEKECGGTRCREVHVRGSSDHLDAILIADEPFASISGPEITRLQIQEVPSPHRRDETVWNAYVEFTPEVWKRVHSELVARGEVGERVAVVFVEERAVRSVRRGFGASPFLLGEFETREGAAAILDGFSIPVEELSPLSAKELNDLLSIWNRESKSPERAAGEGDESTIDLEERLLQYRIINDRLRQGGDSREAADELKRLIEPD